ncbi:MAG: PQQ-like beta-propeller repeat protein [Pirellulales bacterium]|nr:PQQ-like beta-propeller repeat protein [Pirellulales bacterium]
MQPSATETTASTNSPPALAPQRPRLWPGAILVALFWSVFVGVRVFDAPISTGFMSIMGASMLLTLAFTIWWLANGTVRWADRLWGLAAMIAGCVAAALLCDRSVGVVGLIFLGLPLAFTAWLGWLIVSRRFARHVQLTGTVIALGLVWLSQIVIRVNGVDGSNQASVSLRWSPTAEDEYVAQLAKVGSAAPSPADGTLLEPRDGDWLDFRGPLRRGEVRGVQFATDWNSSPPKELWRRKIGPAWSSLLVIDGRLFTQEQRGDLEAVVCLDAAAGTDVWAHTDAVRFSDGQAGAGPRATPTFVGGRIYAQGATGLVNCLDAATGQRIWTRDIVADTKAPLPMWGFSSSPLIVGNVVVVYGGAQPNDRLLGYKADSGAPAWQTATGAISYSSAQLATFDGEPQLLFFSDAGLAAIEPASGTRLWSFDAPQNGIWRVVQPRQLDDGTVLIGCEDLGLVRLAISRQNDGWSVAPRWKSRAIRPAYNDFVISGDSIYGFDESIFCCVDVATGQRRWKAGRYGHG